MATKTTKAMNAKDKATVEGEWHSSEPFFEKALDAKRTLKACIATSPDGSEFVSIREWRAKQDGTPYYTRNSMLIGKNDADMKQALLDALAAVPAPTKKASAKRVKVAA